jgi:glyoxalase family protein
MSEMAILGFHHVELAGHDLERSLRFYRDVLGLRPMAGPDVDDDPAARQVVLGVGDGAPGTRLVIADAAGEQPGAWGVGGVHHVALGTADEAALLMWKRWLTDQGVRVSGPFDRGWFNSIYFTDPDGQVLEIATAGPGYALDEPADRLGERPILPEAGRLRGGRDEAGIRARSHPEPVDRITPAMALDGIHHVSGITDDVELGHAFYQELLGLRRVKQTVNQDEPSMPHWFWARYDGHKVAPHSTMTLFGMPRARRARAGAGQLRHVAFHVADDASLAAWKERLGEAGIGATEVRERGVQGLFFRAPDGQLLALTADGAARAAPHT